MRAILLLSLMFINSCAFLHIEVRDKRQEPSKVQKEEKKTTPPHREEKKSLISLRMPVLRGEPIKREKGYFIKTPCDEFFRASKGGRVLYAGDDIKSLGWVLMVDTGDYTVVYTRAEKLLVKRGESVREGQVLGKVGKTQGVCGLSIEVRDEEGRPLEFELR